MVQPEYLTLFTTAGLRTGHRPLFHHFSHRKICALVTSDLSFHSIYFIFWAT
jgi:hypothetical protein